MANQNWICRFTLLFSYREVADKILPTSPKRPEEDNVSGSCKPAQSPVTARVRPISKIRIGLDVVVCIPLPVSGEGMADRLVSALAVPYAHNAVCKSRLHPIGKAVRNKPAHADYLL